MKTKIEEYINQVTEQIQFKEARYDVSREFKIHIEENIQMAKSFGLSEIEAEVEALKRMGDPLSVGKKLNLISKPKIDKFLLFLVVALIFFGEFFLITLKWSYNQFAWILVGLIAMTFVYISPYRRIVNFVSSLYLIGFLGIFASLWSGLIFEGQPYLSLMGLHIKIIDLSSVMMAISIPAILEKLPNKYHNLTAPLLVLIPVIYFSFIGSLFPAILILGSCILGLNCFKIKDSNLVIIGLVGTFALLFGSRNVFQNNEQLSSIINSERHTDFIISGISRMNFIASAIVVMILASFVARIFKITNKIKNRWLKSTSMICASLFAIEIFFGINSNLGFTPAFKTGVNLPFLSYGGSLMVAHFFMIGMILAAGKRRNISSFA